MSKMYFDRSGRFAAQWKREQQAGMILDVDINGEDLEDAVRKWMASNEDVWRAWIPNRGLRCSVPFRVDRSARNAVFLTLPELGTGGKRVSPAVSWTLPRGAESGAGSAGRFHGGRVPRQPVHLADLERPQSARIGGHRLDPALAWLSGERRGSVHERGLGGQRRRLCRGTGSGGSPRARDGVHERPEPTAHTSVRRGSSACARTAFA